MIVKKIFLVGTLLVFIYLVFHIFQLTSEYFTEKEKVRELLNAYQSGNVNYMRLRNNLIESTEHKSSSLRPVDTKVGESNELLSENEKETGGIDKKLMNNLKKLVSKRKYRLQLVTNISKTWRENNKDKFKAFESKINPKGMDTTDTKYEYLTKFVNNLDIEPEEDVFVYDGISTVDDDPSSPYIIHYSLDTWVRPEYFKYIVIKKNETDKVSELVELPLVNKKVDDKDVKFKITEVRLITKDENYLDIDFAKPPTPQNPQPNP